MSRAGNAIILVLAGVGLTALVWIALLWLAGAFNSGGTARSGPSATATATTDAQLEERRYKDATARWFRESYDADLAIRHALNLPYYDPAGSAWQRQVESAGRTFSLVASEIDSYVPPTAASEIHKSWRHYSEALRDLVDILHGYANTTKSRWPRLRTEARDAIARAASMRTEAWEARKAWAP
ncbi:MAG TPA: hypothetical protein VGE45_00575 [Chloroflexia bacterium]